LQRSSPHFYRDGLLQHTRTVSHVGEPLQQSARALVSHCGRPLQHNAAAFSLTAVDRCSTPLQRYSRPLQHCDFSPWRTAAANRCSISVRYIIFLTPAHRYSRLLQHGRTGYIRQLQQVAAAH